MATTNQDRLKKLNNYKTSAVAAGVILLGIAVLGFGLSDVLQDGIVKVVVQQLGGTLVASGALGVIWDFVGKRAIVDEVFEKIDLQNEVRASGLRNISMEWQSVDWSRLFDESRNVTIFVASGNTWKNNNHAQLTAFAARSRRKLTLILPDPLDDLTIQNLATRFSKTPDVIRQGILETAMVVASLPTGNRTTVEVRFWTGDSMFALYKFNDRFIITMYSHAGRGRIPTFTTDDGDLSVFCESNLKFILEHSRLEPSDALREGRFSNAI